MGFKITQTPPPPPTPDERLVNVLESVRELQRMIARHRSHCDGLPESVDAYLAGIHREASALRDSLMGRTHQCAHVWVRFSDSSGEECKVCHTVRTHTV